MTNLVIGWGAISEFVGFNEDIVRRWSALYGFPKPIENKHKKKWNRAEVRVWMDNNSEFIKSELNRCNLYRRVK